ncbi:putative transferase [Tripterygium wilfordii]|uniref:Putative transferase n=1 Tax=Tripterygium wilfordii TaxID=458696 RepID=A0A7J7C662_TRIWF|nr:putative transferase [Tripterygium wilfordii]
MAMEGHIEAVQTVPPFKVTDPRQVHQVSVADAVASATGWVKESLARAQAEQLVLSGRLRRGEEGHGYLEIVANDSGVRLVKAKLPVTVAEFLDLKERDKDAGAQLVFWKDIEEQNPQYPPLLLFRTDTVARIPTFYFPNLKKMNTSPASFFPSSQNKNDGQTMVFTSKTVYPANEVAMVCIEEAESKIGRKSVVNFVCS